MVTVDIIISQLESFDRTATIEDLLEKPDVVNFLRETFDNLPPKSKTIARNISSKTPTSSKSKSRCASLVAILEVGEVALPEEVQTLFNECKKNPSKFWRSVGTQNDAICFTRGEPIDTVASQAYIGLTALDTQRKWDTITWRYYTLFFYDLILLIGGGKTNLTAGLHKKLFEALDKSPLITDSLDIIKDNINTWITAGSRYSKFCKSLDDGALFLLPPLSDRIWEDAHSLCGSAYDQAVQHLIDLKICELSTELGADALGTHIRAAAIDPFRWSVETFRVAQPLHSKAAAGGPGFIPDAQHSEKRARKRPKRSNHTPPGKRQKKSNQTRPGQQTEHHCPVQPVQPVQPLQPSMGGTIVRQQSTGWYSTDAANLEMLSTAASATSTAHQTSTHGQVDPCEKGTQVARFALHYPITGQSEYHAPTEMLTMATIMASPNIPNTPHAENPAFNNCNLHGMDTNAINFNVHDLNNYAIDFNVHDLNNYAIDFNLHDLNNYAIDLNLHDLNNYAIDYDSCDYSETPPHHSR